MAVDIVNTIIQFRYIDAHDRVIVIKILVLLILRVFKMDVEKWVLDCLPAITSNMMVFARRYDGAL